ncbi:MAG: HAMP domain-containing sensor histidine kinase [Gemmatimonadota bacterium]
MPLTAVLVLTVSLSLWLGYEAWASARNHRAAVEAVLRDYTGMAAREFSRLSRESLAWLLEESLEEDRRQRRNDGSLPADIAEAIASALDRHDCACPALRRPSSLFHVLLPAGSSTVLPGPDGGTVLPELVDELRTRVEGPSSRGRGLVLPQVGDSVSGSVAIAYSMRWSRDERGTDVYGFVVPVAGIGQLVEHWYENNPLLPPSPDREAANDSLLFARIEMPAGQVLFASRHEEREGLASTDTVGTAWGGLRVLVDVRAGAADRLVAGGLPPSRTPLFLGMMVLVGLVGFAGLVQIRREEELARLRDDFVSGVSHELRTPLTQIRMFAELHGGGKLRTEEDRRRAIAVIDREARRLSNLVESVLQFTRLRRAPAPNGPLKALPLGEAVEQAVEGFQPLLEAKGVQIRRAVDPGLRVAAPEGSIRQILLNLLDNAVKYGPEGQIVDLRAARSDGAIRITVDDQGPGVPPRERKRIWAPYRRLAGDGGGNEPGTGLGLAVVGALVSQLRGAAWVEEAPAGGARFVVELPEARAESAPPGASS